MRKFVSSPDQMSHIIIYGVIATMIVIFFVGYFAYRKSGGEPLILVFVSLGPVILLTIMMAMYVLQPLSVTVGNSAMTIDRRVKPVSISYSDIKTVRLLEKGEMSGVLRTFGNGGLFGYTGLYYNKKFGSMTWYCTQRRNYILIEKKDDKKVVITPDDPTGFLQALRDVSPAIASPQ